MPQIRQSASSLIRLHKSLCSQRAFPTSLAQYRDAHAQLLAFEAEQSSMWDTGIAGTPIHYGFSFEVAKWLARRTQGSVSIDWEGVADTTRLDDLLSHLLQSSEDEYFDSGYVSSQEWIDQARAGSAGNDFDWLLGQFQDKRSQQFLSPLYDAADLPLTWNLGDGPYSKSCNTFPVKVVRTRENGLRGRPRLVKQEIQRPLESIARLSVRDGARMIDVAMASLAVRHRETYHFNFANPREVYLADVGEGVSVAVFGLFPKHRFPLECTMGFLILSNGVPIGYGGSSIVFRQVNTGINIFDEYRGSEASFLWTQVMRVYYALVGCTRFIANPYQLGGENIEALKSGAFWFYYRLGYRPVLPGIKKLARREAARVRRNKTYRSNIKTLRKLASCDMHLTLPGARASDLFEERWIETSSMLAAQVLGAAGGATHQDSANNVANALARDVGLRSTHRWSAAERRAFISIAPIVAAANPGTWSADAKRSIRKLLRAKGGDSEATYARLLSEHDTFLNALRKACRSVDP